MSTNPTKGRPASTDAAYGDDRRAPPFASVETFDVGAEGTQRRGEVVEAAIDVLAAVPRRLAVGREPGEHERGAGADVGRGHRRAREPFDTADDRVPAFRAHVGAHARELVDEMEATVVDVLGDDRVAVGDRHERDR